MKASEANRLATDVKQSRLNKELAEVLKDIEGAAKKGDFSVPCKDLSSGTRLELLELGYTIEDVSDMRDPYPDYRIYWNK